ncbi:MULTISPECIES: hypothetical protein [unclassified Flavobacterium]|uniref:hypothetical protein n=1 Tax=unclassified Flavobacterium TaxID=196869 RepID=UPI001F144EB4|nr:MULTISPECIES: hypothetical protein [unclassified Flavobacterium]UMY64514.1 hypothetical protein MKO97_08315 [Flavobacterium sp. HJ-32-4]
MEKYILGFIAFISSTLIFAQNQTVGRSEQVLSVPVAMTATDSIQITDLEGLQKVLDKSAKPYKVLYFFSPACSSSLYLFPKIYKLYSQHSALFDFIAISGFRYDRIPEMSSYMKYNGFRLPVYVLDTKKYGNGKNPFKRLDLVSTTFCQECKVKKMGFSAFFVLDSHNKVVAHTNWDLSGEESYNLLVTSLMK